MKLDRDSGLVSGVVQVASPNCDERPDPGLIDTLVIHAISLPPDSFGGPHIAALFCNQLNPEAHPYFAEICHLQVSTHFLIDRAGEVTQFVSCNQRAWHAGESTFCGRSRVNDFSIGIELEGCDTMAFENSQYQSLIELTQVVRAGYADITEERIVGHSDIAPGRKTDPGPCFDWSRYRKGLTESGVANG